MALEKVMEEGTERAVVNKIGSKSLGSVITEPIKVYFKRATNFKPGSVYWSKSKEDECLLHTSNTKFMDIQMDVTSIEIDAGGKCDEVITIKMNKKSRSSEYKKVWVLLRMVMITLCFHMCTTPLIVKVFHDYFDLNSQFFIDFSLKKTSNLPDNLSYGLDEAYVYSYDDSYGMLFSHNNLESELCNSAKASVVNLKRLFTILRSDYESYSMIPFVTGTRLSAIITVSVGIALYIICIAAIYCRNKIYKKKAYYRQDKKSRLAEFEQSRLILAVLFIVVLHHMIVSPFFIYIYTINTENVIDVPLKKTSSLPANLSYSLDDVFVFRNDNFFGLIFTRNDLKTTVGNFFTNSVSFTPLLSLIQPNCIFDGMIYLNIIALYTSAIFSAHFGLFILSLYNIITVYFRNFPH